MEVRDGLIVGIYNYCDRWCDTCALTSCCRVFADLREMEAAEDPNLKPLVDAPPHPADLPPPPPPWLQELISEMNEHASRPMTEEAHERRPLRTIPERDAIECRSDIYLRRTYDWLQKNPESEPPGVGDPRSVISWFHMMIHVKSMRALHGLEKDDPSERDWPADHDGSAKVALIGIDRSERAWRDLVSLGLVSPADVAAFIDDLTWLRDALERVFPKARSFIRPGFDEPADVARLLRGE